MGHGCLAGTREKCSYSAFTGLSPIIMGAGARKSEVGRVCGAIVLDSHSILQYPAIGSAGES